jgi:hypothetical protein
VTVRISVNPDRINIIDTMTKMGYKIIYLGDDINSEGKIDEEPTRKEKTILNSIILYTKIYGTDNQCKTVPLHFKPILYNMQCQNMNSKAEIQKQNPNNAYEIL